MNSDCAHFSHYLSVIHLSQLCVSIMLLAIQWVDGQLNNDCSRVICEPSHLQFQMLFPIGRGIMLIFSWKFHIISQCSSLSFLLPFTPNCNREGASGKRLRAFHPVPFYHSFPSLWDNPARSTRRIGRRAKGLADLLLWHVSKYFNPRMNK